MTEQTDKASGKSSKAVPKKRPAKSRSPKSKRAKAPDRRTKPDSAAKAKPARADRTKRAESKSLAPDPATITFGSQRPIVAQPQKLPEGSGLRFSGPSAGELKGSGPQPSSAKASGLTFTNAKSPGGNGNRPGGGAVATPSEIKAKAPATRKSSGTKAADKTGDGKAPDRSALTKPAIAPQANGRRLEKERSSRGFALTLVGLVVAVGVLAYWIGPGSEPATTTGDLAALQPAPALQTAPAVNTPSAPVSAIDVPAADDAVPLVLGPSPRAPTSPGPLAAPALSVAEIMEIQQLLQRLDLGPGDIDGVVNAETTAAIRSYQEMAGLAGDGEANRALLEELRSVVALYGG